MDRAEKLEFQQQTENYLEDNQVYDLFERLMKDLIIDRPVDPIDYLIKKLETPSPVRVFIVGPPGSSAKRKELALTLAETMAYTCISVSDLLAKEITKRSQYGQEIEEAKKTHSFVNDNIVIDIVKKEIERSEDEKKSWILEGFPRTRVQALSLQRLGIIPDNFIILESGQETIVSNVKGALTEAGSDKAENELAKIAQDAALEYNLNISGVKELYRGFFSCVESDKSDEEVLHETARLLKLRGESHAPRRPPRVIILGPPGSGRSTQASIIAQRYGLVYVSTSQLLKDEIAKKSDIGKTAMQCIATGELISDDMITALVEYRLKQTDCKVKGWILDGYPKNAAQVHSLNQMGLSPSLVVMLEIADNVVYERLENKRLDPITGTVYDMVKNKPQSKEVEDRLIQNPEETHDVLKKRLARWRASVSTLEQSFGKVLINLAAEKEAESLSDYIGDAIQNPPYS